MSGGGEHYAMFKASVFVLLLGAAAFAADVTGKWTGQVPARGGETREATFTLKAEGDKLTGTMSGPQGDRQISEGKITGDTISFAVEGQRGKQVYTGTVTGDEIKFKREGGQGQPREFTAKRAK
jgi:hypothetical protein